MILTNSNNNTIRNVVFFCCGLYACFCDNLCIPKAVSLACLLPAIYCIYITILSEQGKTFGFEGKSFIEWYGLFLLFVCISALWSPNAINSSTESTETTVFVYKRAFNPFFLTLIYYQLKPSLEELYITLKGILVGALFGCIVGIVAESHLIGYGRFGAMSYGAGPEFGNVALFGLIISLLFIYKEKKWIYVLLLVFNFFVIIISASRQPLVCGIICMSIIHLLRKKNSLSSYVSFVIFSLAVGLLLFYLIMYIDFFYDAIGYRFQSMLDKDDGSDIERTIMCTYAMELFRDNPIAGVGVHGFATFFGRWYGWTVWSHCGYTEILSCYGIIGFILYYRYFIRGGGCLLYVKK